MVKVEKYKLNPRIGGLTWLQLTAYRVINDIYAEIKEEQMKK